jgi:hypothetical protein
MTTSSGVGGFNRVSEVEGNGTVRSYPTFGESQHMVYDTGAPRLDTPDQWCTTGIPVCRAATSDRMTRVDDATALHDAADRLERLAARSTPGDWRVGGLLASRPEVVAHRADGGTEHVAEARAASAAWVAAVSPAVAGPLAALLRALADPAAGTAEGAAAELARLLRDRLP